MDNKIISTNEKRGMNVRRVHSFVWSSIAALICIVLGIVFFTKGDNKTGIVLLVSSVLVFTFISNLILDNNFIPEMWLTISSFGIKLPGIIFEFSLDGFILLVVLKLIFWLIGALFSLGCGIFATLLSLVLSPFVYPFALSKNIKGVE